jgi:hypothetical protein
VNKQDTEYLARVAQGITTLPHTANLTTRCPECDVIPTPCLVCDSDECDGAGVAHGMVGEYVVIGCEGYYVVDPNLVGIDSPNWQPVEAEEDDVICLCDAYRVDLRPGRCPIHATGGAA